ncbi:hypothetical protein D3C78_1824870 [compost metagenome]
MQAALRAQAQRGGDEGGDVLQAAQLPFEVAVLGDLLAKLQEGACRFAKLQRRGAGQACGDGLL